MDAIADLTGQDRSHSYNKTPSGVTPGPAGSGRTARTEMAEAPPASVTDNG